MLAKNYVSKKPITLLIEPVQNSWQTQQNNMLDKEEWLVKGLTKLFTY